MEKQDLNINYIVEVKDLSVMFSMPSEKIDSMKEYVLKRIRGMISYNEFYALKNISFFMRKGESIGLVGLNGSGKSTLLKTVAGVLKPYEGSVNVAGKIAPLIELGAGFDGDLTAEENVFLNGALLGYSHKEMKDNFNNIIEFAELQSFVTVPIKNFSSGMLARLGFSIATFGTPDLLIVDEALSVGDFRFQEKCEERIKEVLNNGASLLFVSHSIEQVEKLCDRVIWLEEGRIKADGETGVVAKKYKNAYK